MYISTVSVHGERHGIVLELSYVNLCYTFNFRLTVKDTNDEETGNHQ
jgi:hypothetical protein